jgi:hypothetical protein
MGNNNSRISNAKPQILVDIYGFDTFRHFFENNDNQKIWLNHIEFVDSKNNYSLQGNKIVKKTNDKVDNEYEIYICTSFDNMTKKQEDSLFELNRFAVTEEISKIIREGNNKFKVIFYKENGPRIGIFRDDPTNKMTWMSAVGINHLARVLRGLADIKYKEASDNYTYPQLQNLFAQDLVENRYEYQKMIDLIEKNFQSVPQRFNIFKTWFKYMDENNVDMILKMNKAFLSGKNNVYPQYLFSTGAYSPKFILEDTKDADYKNLVEINGYGISNDSHLSDVSFDEKDIEWKGWNLSLIHI